MRFRSRARRVPRRVAYLHDNAAFGGMETLQVEIVRHLDRSRYEPFVVIAVPITWEASRRFEQHLASEDAPLLARRDGLDFNTSSGSTASGLVRLLRAERFEVAHIQTRTPMASRNVTLATALARVPAVVRTEHVSPGPHTDRWTRFKVRPFDWMTDVIMTDSKGDRQQQIELVGRRPSKVMASYCGIDPFRFDPDHSTAAAKEALGLDPATLVVGTVGRLHEQKGHRYLVSAAARVLERHRDTVTFLIVGDGPDEAKLRDQAEAAGIADRVQFAGFQAQPLRYMKAMDIVAMPSLWEGFSISMQEFMALGKPMVVSDHHSFQEAIVHGEHGLIVPAADEIALADGILTLIDDDVLRKHLSGAAAERARRDFSIQRYVDELMDVYDRLLDGVSGRSPTP